MPKICSSKATKLVCLGLLGASLATDGYSATSSLISGALLPGNQQAPALCLGADGGFVVWQDDRIDGRGWGIALRRLDKDLRPAPEAAVLVNSQKSYNQECPQVACLPDGSAIVVWQGGRRGQGDIYYRKISSRGTWLTSEAFVNTYRVGEQMSPAVAALSEGDAVVAWTSVNQDGAYKGIFGRRILSASGGSPDQMRLSSPAGREDYGPSLAPLPGGGFVCSWISGSKSYWRQEGRPEDRRAGDAVVLARVFNSVGAAMSGEISVSENGGLAGSTTVAATKEGFVVAWFDKKNGRAFFRRYGPAGVSIGGAVAITDPQQAFGQVAVAAGDSKLEFVWLSNLAADRKKLVYSREFSLDTGIFTPSAKVSSAGASVLRETMPVVSGDGYGRVLVLWSSYNSGSAFDVMGTQLR